MYKISTENLEESIENAQENVESAQKAYNRAVGKKEELIVKSKVSGTVGSLEVTAGDMVRNGDTIADVYSSDTVSLEVPFQASEVRSTWVGKKADVYLTSSKKTVKGKVTSVGTASAAGTGNNNGTANAAQMTGSTVMVQIEIPVSSSAKAGLNAKATVAGKDSVDSAKLCRIQIGTLTSTTEGTIKSLNIKKGSTIKKGNTVLTVSSDSVSDAI